MIMDPKRSLQDVIRCHLCETPVSSTSLYCDVCNKYLCKDCERKHLSDSSKQHKMVPFEKRILKTNCLKHTSKLCNFYCEVCDISLCAKCRSSKEHQGHKVIEISKEVDRKKQNIQNDLQELRKYIYPKYQEIASVILAQKFDLKENPQKLTSAIDKHGEDMHRDIETMIQKLKSDVDVMDC